MPILTKRNNLRAHSRLVTTRQNGIHAALPFLLQKHQQSPFLRPLAGFSADVFQIADEFVQSRGVPIMLDMCCGTGQSSQKLAAQYPHLSVVGFDQSQHRLQKTLASQEILIRDNLLICRANAVDFIRQAVWHHWRCAKLWILYPNPYPKPQHIGRRWHGHALLPYLLALADEIELRSNWLLYLQEFAFAAQFVTKLQSANTILTAALTRLNPARAADYLTPFEQKYAQSLQHLYQLHLASAHNIGMIKNHFADEDLP